MSSLNTQLIGIDRVLIELKAVLKGFLGERVALMSKEEMEDIEKLYGKPSTEKETAYSETIEL